jgi:hypothetical protein
MVDLLGIQINDLQRRVHRIPSPFWKKRARQPRVRVSDLRGLLSGIDELHRSIHFFGSHVLS